MIALSCHPELVSASLPESAEWTDKWTLKQVQGDVFPFRLLRDSPATAGILFLLFLLLTASAKRDSGLRENDD